MASDYDALANEPVHLRNSVTVTSDSVLLGDLFTGLSDSGDTVVAKAPAPGQRLNLGARQLRQIANRYKLSWRPANGREVVRIERESRAVPLEAARTALRDALINDHASDQIEIELTNRRLKILVAADQNLSVRVHDLTYDRRTRQFTAALSAPADDPNAPRVAVNGRVYALVDMPVLQRHIRPGETIRRRDIGWRSVRTERSTYNTINDAEELVGQTAKRPLIAGRLVRRSDVKPRQLVAKGDFVTVHFRAKKMMLTSRGVAMENGARGDVIRLRNPRSKKVIEAKVIGPNVAVIQLPQLAALN